MTNVLIDNIKLIEKWKLATPIMERMVVDGGWCYMAGSLILNMPDPLSKSNFTTIDIEPIGDFESEIIQYGMYLASRIFENSGKTGSCFYKQALSNIKEYELVHGRELEPSGTVVIN
jgi:hypothetical protein